MQVWIDKEAEGGADRQQLNVTGVQVRMPRVTFAMPHDITFETDEGITINLRGTPKEMQQVVELIKKSWDKYDNGGPIPG